MGADTHQFNADPDPSFHFNVGPDPVFCFNAGPDPAIHFYMDPDPAFYLNADPDPAFHFNADPDPDPAFHFRSTSQHLQWIYMYSNMLYGQKFGIRIWISVKFDQHFFPQR